MDEYQHALNTLVILMSHFNDKKEAEQISAGEEKKKRLTD